jgi:hypothetical protein
MDPTLASLLSFIPEKYRPAVQGLIEVFGAFWLLSKTLDSGFIQPLLKLFPNNRALAVADHWASALVSRWPKSLTPGAPAPAALSTVVKTIGLALILALGGAARAQDLTAGLPGAQPPPIGLSFGNPTFYHGPSAPFFEVFPNQKQVVQVLAGAGYEVAICDGTLAVGGKSMELVCVALNAFVGPNVQLVPELAFLGGIVGVGPVLTPYSFNDQGGFLQGGRPGTGWALSLCLPVSWL